MSSHLSVFVECLPVVPVEEQPVDSLQLVLSELVPIVILSGLINLLPGTCSRSRLMEEQVLLIINHCLACFLMKTKE